MIACFSGTGNSLIVARLLAGRLGDSITGIAAGSQIAPGGERVIWVFPVYSWGLPPIVDDFIAAQRHLAGRSHYCVLTCGDDTGRADRRWRRAMHRAGADDLRGCWSVQMPNTYVLLPGFDVDSPATAAAKTAAAPARVDTIARHIAAGSCDTDVVAGSLPGLKSYVIYPFFRRHMMSPRPFRATAACTGCGRCARGCPLANITMTDGTPHWGDRCTLCLRCYHGCPSRAVAYGRATARKGQKPLTL